MSNGHLLSLDEEKKSTVLAELEKILESEAFRPSKRGQQFLAYVVTQTLHGKGELLKERTIGADVFERGPDGITTENSVVRKQAGEVRRRLEQYYEDEGKNSALRIDLPRGSYVPEFRFVSVAPSGAETALPSTTGQSTVSPVPMVGKTVASKEYLHRWIIVIAVLLVAAACLGIWEHRRHSVQYPLFTRFWEPVSATPESVVVCVAKPVVYIPSREFFQKYSRAHGGDFGPEWQRLNERLPAKLDPSPGWEDMRFQEDYGIARGDAYAAFRMAALFSSLGKSSQLRIGNDCSLADLRSAPVTLIGAYNNRWTMQMTSTLHFVFFEQQGEVSIREDVPAGKEWKTKWSPTGQPAQSGMAVELLPVTDFALVSRLRSSQTGQYLTVVAGMTSPGTQAAAELVSNPKELDLALQRIAPGWESKNLQIVLQVSVPNGITPTSPQVVATYSW